ncbi:hypothetical protein HDU67_007484 [Dinochytrium kinnereticum]|nr:hypothetical protein HDU67_007484 [Dinochytrium kinnereticum]
MECCGTRGLRSGQWMDGKVQAVVPEEFQLGFSGRERARGLSMDPAADNPQLPSGIAGDATTDAPPQPAHEGGGAPPETMPSESEMSIEVEVPQLLQTQQQAQLPASGYNSKARQYMDEQEQQDALFVQCETEYQDTLAVIQGDEALVKFRLEYEKMHRALLRSRHHAIVLYKQYETLFNDYTSNVALAQEAIKSSLQDDQVQKTLKSHIQKAEETTEACNKQEEALKEELRLLKQEITTLNTTVKQGVGLSVNQERTLNELMAAKDSAVKELEMELERIVQLRVAISELTDKVKLTDQLKREREHEIYELKERNAAKKADIDSELRNKERLERDLRELRVVVAVKSQEVRGKQDAVNRATDDIGILESQIKSQKQLLEKLFKDQEALQLRTIKLQQDCNEQITMTTQLIEENSQLGRDIKVKEQDLSKTRAEVKKVNKIRDALVKKNRSLEDQRVEVEQERRSLRSRNDSTLQDIDRMKRAIDATKKAIDDLERERDILQINSRKTAGETNKHVHASILFKQTRHNLEVELARENAIVSEQLKAIKLLEQDRDTYTNEAAKVQALCVSGLQQIKEKETEIFEFKKKMIKADTKLKHQQNLYEAVQSDRNLHCKHLIESQAEIAEMKRRLKIMNFQINGYKEDINAKEEALVHEASENGKLEKDIEIITDEVKTLKNQNELAQAYIRSQLAEEMKLNQFVKEADLERTRQENALRVLISERDNLSAQLIRQNEELSKAYNLIKTQQSSLCRSELYYQEKLKALAQIRGEILDCRQQLRSLCKATMDVEATRKASLQMRNEIIRERTRKKALEDELENPVNVHRWRKLEGSNPKAFEMIQLLHTLQRSLIEKTKEDQEKGKIVETKEQLYLHLKTILSKQVGPEAVEQVSEFQQILKDKHLQLKHMSVELNMYQSQVREYKHSISVLNRSLDGLKSDYMEAKRMGRLGGSGGNVPGTSHSPTNRSASSRAAPSAEPAHHYGNGGSGTPSPLPPLPSGPLVSSKGDMVDAGSGGRTTPSEPGGEAVIRI